MGALLEEAEAGTGSLHRDPAVSRVIPTVAPYLLPTVLRLFHRRYPRMDLQVHEDQTSSCRRLAWPEAARPPDLALPSGSPGSPNCPSSTRTSYSRPPGNIPSRPPRHTARGTAGPATPVARRGALPARSGPGHLPRGGPDRRGGRHHHRRRTVHPRPNGRRRTGGDAVAAHRAAVGDRPQRVPGHRVLRRARPSRRIALAMRTGTARQQEFRAIAAALREAVRPLPVWPAE